VRLRAYTDLVADDKTEPETQDETEFEKFENFAKKIVAIPKREIDAARRRAERERREA
jgi:hypothetical protein